MRSVPGWTQECKEAQMRARRLRRQYQRTRSERDWDAYREARNCKGRLIKKTLRDAYRVRVREATATQDGLWRIARWARKRGIRQSFTPPLTTPLGQLEHDHRAKAQLFKDAFFPPPPSVDLSDVGSYVYQDPIPLPPITDHEVCQGDRYLPRPHP